MDIKAKQLEPYVENGRTVNVSPPKVYGPESNSLALQLRKRSDALGS